MMFSPPEITNPGALFYEDMADKVDVWCFGMLLWQLIIDGDAFKLDADNTIDFGKMIELRRDGQVSSVAESQCKRHMEVNHGENRELHAEVLGILKSTLEPDSRNRPTGAQLSTRLLKMAKSQ